MQQMDFIKIKSYEITTNAKTKFTDSFTVWDITRKKQKNRGSYLYSIYLEANPICLIETYLYQNKQLFCSLISL